MINNSAFYSRILNHMTCGVSVVDQERTITFWNKGAERLSGFSAGEVIGKKCSAFLNLERVVRKISAFLNEEPYPTESGFITITCSLGGGIVRQGENMEDFLVRAERPYDYFPL